MGKEQKWIVRDLDGKISQPLSTEEVLSQIDDATFTGEELIALYPGGNWQKISNHLEFSDKLLEALASSGTSVHRRLKATDEDVVDGQNEVTLPPVIEEEDEEQEPEFYTKPQQMRTQVTMPHESGSRSMADRPNPTLTPQGAPGGTNAKVGTPPPVIELRDLGAHVKKEKWKRSKAPLLLVGLACIALFAALLVKPKSDDGRLHLVAPRKKQPPIADEQVKRKALSALQDFQKDTYSHYIAAENDLVEIIEGSPKSTEAMQLLCLTYRELWPYVFQDSKDLEAISSVMRAAKAADPTSVDGAVCEIVNLMVNDKTDEANNLTELWLRNQPGVAVFYDLKGELLLVNRDFNTALPYFEKAVSLWPAWQKLHVQQARSQSFLSMYPEAIENYRQVLLRVPSHGVAKIEMGILEYRLFQHLDKAYDLISAAVDNTDKVPRTVLADGYVALGDIELQRGKKQAAIAHFKQAYAINPTSSDAKKRLQEYGQAGAPLQADAAELLSQCSHYLKSGEFIAAQAECKSAFKKDPTRGLAALKAGEALWQLNQTGEAIAWVQKAIQADRNLVDAYVTLADYFSQRFDFESAFKVLQTAYSLMPKRYEVMRGYAIVSLRKNDFRGAETAAERSLKIYEGDSETLLVMAQAKMGLGKFTEAQSYVGRAIEIDQTNADAQCLYAKVLASTQGAGAGISYLGDLIRAYARQNKYRTALADIYIQNENYAEAEQVLRELLSLDPENKKAIITLGKVLKALGRYNEALEQFFLAGVKDPSDANPIFLAGELNFQTGKYLQAADQFAQVLTQNAKYPLAHYNRGKALMLLGRFKDALDEARLEQAMNPNLADGYILAAEINYSMKQYSGCASEFQKALQKAPQPSETYVKMARCTRRSGSLDAALSLLREAEAKESGNPNVYKELGAIYQTKGMGEEALKSYDRYIALSPGAPDRRQVEDQMHKIESGNTSLDPESF